jgi:hypothetical protein
VKECEFVVEIQMERLTFPTTHTVYTDESPTAATLYLAVYEQYFDIAFFRIYMACNFSAASKTAVLTVLPSFGRDLTNESLSRMVATQFLIYIYIYIYLFIYFHSLHVSSNLVLIIRRDNCINTTSGICHSV